MIAEAKDDYLKSEEASVRASNANIIIIDLADELKPFIGSWIRDREQLLGNAIAIGKREAEIRQLMTQHQRERQEIEAFFALNGPM